MSSKKRQSPKSVFANFVRQGREDGLCRLAAINNVLLSLSSPPTAGATTTTEEAENEEAKDKPSSSKKTKPSSSQPPQKKEAVTVKKSRSKLLSVDGFAHYCDQFDKSVGQAAGVSRTYFYMDGHKNILSFILERNINPKRHRLSHLIRDYQRDENEEEDDDEDFKFKDGPSSCYYDELSEEDLENCVCILLYSLTHAWMLRRDWSNPSIWWLLDSLMGQPSRTRPSLLGSVGAILVYNNNDKTQSSLSVPPTEVPHRLHVCELKKGDRGSTSYPSCSSSTSSTPSQGKKNAFRRDDKRRPITRERASSSKVEQVVEEEENDEDFEPFSAHLSLSLSPPQQEANEASPSKMKVNKKLKDEKSQIQGSFAVVSGGTTMKNKNSIKLKPRQKHQQDPQSLVDDFLDEF